jgi:crotonobetainyl-CoA:carnitine CoA-transferase CaiB-like acyl-CoA transferase
MLADVVVLEAGRRESTAWCGRVLADLGAQVHRMAAHAAHTDDATGGYLHAGKATVSSTVALGVIDVVVTDDRDSTTEQLLARLRERNRRLVTVSVTDYGLTGPLAHTPASELTLQAEAGVVALHPTGDRPPVGMGINVSEQVSGRWAAAAAVMGLLAVDAGAPGTEADISRFEAAASVLQFPWLYSQLYEQGHFPYPVPQMAVPGIEPCTDGWVCIVAISPQQWAQFKKLAANPALDDSRFDAPTERVRLVDEIRTHIREFTAQYTVAELVELGVAHRIPIVPVTTPHTVADFTPYAERDAVRCAANGRLADPQPPFRIKPNGVAGSDRSSPAATSATPDRPLQGLRVVEIGAFQAGPLVGTHLAALGADVIRVESVHKPDMLRFLGAPPDVDRFWERAAPFLGVNIGKRAITADLTNPQGRRIVEQLIASSDVLVENYVPRVLDARGLDYAGVRKLREDIVMVRMPAWGSSGQWSDNPGFTFTANAAAGLSWLTGYADGEPLLTGTAIDPIAGLVATTVALAAIRRQRLSGTGALIEVPLCDVALQLTATQIEAASAGAAITRSGNCREDGVLQGVYRARDGRWVALTVAADASWAGLLDFTRERKFSLASGLAAGTGLARHGDELDGYLTRLCAHFDSAELVASLRRYGVAAARVEVGTDLVDHPQIKERQRVYTVDHPVVGPLRYIGSPVRFSHDPATAAQRAAPVFGGHSREVLTELGFTAEEIDAFGAAGLLGRSPYNLPFATQG